MRLDLESRTPAVADVNDTGILAWRDNDAVAGDGQPAQVHTG
jgi:hypothetical protein